MKSDVVKNAEMGDAFENLIRRLAEASNETAGEHDTSRDTIRLAVAHVYSMQQAIEEGFILDVLRNDTTYEGRLKAELSS